MCPKGAVSRGERGIWVVVLSSGLDVRFRLHPPPRLPLQGPRHRSSRISPRGLRRRRAFEFCPHRRVCRNPKSGTLGSPAAVRSSGLGWSSAPPTPIPTQSQVLRASRNGGRSCRDAFVRRFGQNSLCFAKVCGFVLLVKVEMKNWH